MKKALAYIAISAALAVSCNKSLDKDEVEAGFAQRGALPEVSIDPSSIVVDQYEQLLTADVTFSGVSSEMKNLELGLLSATDAGFVESSAALVKNPADGTFTLSVSIAAGRTNYVKAMAASDDGAVYSDRITVDVPDIPWYYKISGQYVGTYEPDENTASQGAVAYENHVVTVESEDDGNGVFTVTFYNIDPFIYETLGPDAGVQFNWVSGELDIQTRTVSLPVSGYGVDPSASPYLLSPIASYSADGYGLGNEFVITFNEDASQIQLPWYAIFDQDAGNLPFVYSENGVTLSAN